MKSYPELHAAARKILIDYIAHTGEEHFEDYEEALYQTVESAEEEATAELTDADLIGLFRERAELMAIDLDGSGGKTVSSSMLRAVRLSLYTELMEEFEPRYLEVWEARKHKP